MKIKIGDHVEVYSKPDLNNRVYFILKGVVEDIDGDDYWIRSHSFNEMIKNVKPRKYDKSQVVLDKSKIRLQKIMKITGEQSD